MLEEAVRYMQYLLTLRPRIYSEFPGSKRENNGLYFYCLILLQWNCTRFFLEK